MSPATASIAAGVMLILAGVIGAVGALLGFHAPASHGVGGPQGVSGSRRRRRVSRRTWIAVAAGLVVFAVSGWVAIGAVTAWAVIVVPDLFADKRTDAAIVRLEALAAWTRRLSEQMASGAANSLDVALQRSVVMCPGAIAAPVGRLVERMGPQGTEAALRAWADELDDPASDHLAAALILRIRSGGAGLPAILQDLAVDLDSRVALRRQVAADREKPMSSVRTIVAITAVITALMVVFGGSYQSGSYVAPLRTPTGQVLMLIPAALVAAALTRIRELTKVRVGDRFLNPLEGSR